MNPLLPALLVNVFLFLIAAVMAVVWYNEGQEARDAKAAADANLKKMGTRTERESAPITAIVNAHDKNKGPTVIGEFTKREKKLTSMITGPETTTANAVKQVKAAIGTEKFLLSVISKARTSNTTKDTEIADLKTQLTNAITSKTDAVAAYTKLEQEFKEGVATRDETIREMAAATETAKTAHSEALDANDKKWQEKVDAQVQEVDKLTGKLGEMSLELQKKTQRIVVITAKLREKLDNQELRLAVRPLGKIREIMSDRGVCFVPLGTRDNIVRGMTFRVYGPEGIPKDGEGHKAALTVTRVSQTISQCRITTVKRGDPVAVGDLFANVAYDPTRPQVFVVEGRFDLSGSGRASETGTQEILALIKRCGGKVTTKLTLNVDFVVMGEEPSKPADLDEGAPGPTKKAWEIRMEEYKRWHDTANLAVELNVPKLNTKRFLALTGYEPRRIYE